MPSTFCQVLISARTKSEASKLSSALVKKKLIAGSMTTSGQSSYWWKGKIVNRVYYNISAFSLIKNKSKIISEAKKICSDKCPIVAFFRIDGNKEFLSWIKEFVR